MELVAGPMLILAGAGSGKTRLLTQKYIQLYKKDRRDIFTVTLTHGAARKMRAEISKALPADASGLWVGTFQANCIRLLRSEKKQEIVSRDFVVYDYEDQCRLIRHILTDMKLYEALYKGVVSKIIHYKSHLRLPDKLLADEVGFDFDEKLLKVFVRYQDELKKSNALDPEDLIIYSIDMLTRQPKLLKKYNDAFSCVLVDEFQDINHAQYELLKLLSGPKKNICIAADDDQGTFKSREAGVAESVLQRFERDFQGTTVVRLEQSFRFTKNILDVSSGVISKNANRMPKNLWTERGAGEKVCHCWFTSETEEAKYIAKTIKDYYLKGSFAYEDVAILYRVSFQSKALEDALKNERIPYKIFGCTNLNRKKEIKDVTAFMRLIVNKDDNVSLRRVINVFQKGVGVTTMNKLENIAKKEGISLYQALITMRNLKRLSLSVKEKLDNILAALDRLSSEKIDSFSEAIRLIDEQTGYIDTLKEGELRNVSELLLTYADVPVGEFLDDITLYSSDVDTLTASAVSLTTLQNVKGLEFPVVFISGLEDGLLPHYKATETAAELDEERRLFYLGMTRARDILFMTGARKRKLYSKLQKQEPSRFIKDIPKDCCLWIEKTAIPSNTPIDECAVIDDKVYMPYNTGCRVKHPKWGVGVIRDCYGDDNDVKVTVNFPNVGVKRLALKFANLERI
jgi:DNA helicase-2/ATP-dependent DNA helicase PcrA